MAHKGIRHKVQYFTNKEKGIVVARINDCKEDFIYFLKGTFWKNDFVNFHTNALPY